MNNEITLIDSAIANYGIAISKSLLTVLAAAIIYKLLRRSVIRLSRKGYIARQLRELIVPMLKWLVYIITLLLVIGYFGVSVASFWAALSGVLALVALGFVAVWSVLSNILCSILLTIFAPFRIGDEIEVQDPAAPVSIRGKVTGMNMIFTTLSAIEETDKMRDHTVIRIPNNVFFQKYVRCWPGKRTHSLKDHLAKESSEDKGQV